MIHLTAALTLLAYLPAVSSQQYELVKKYTAQNFFEEFTFYTGQDPTGGFVQYVPFETAAASGLIGNASDLIYLGVDTTNTYPLGGPGRPSVRLESKMTFTEGLFVLDLTHMPVGCGIWPAFWTVGLGDWPTDGEIDIIENVNDAIENNAGLHTVGECSVSGLADQTGIFKSTDCNIAHDGNQGCGSRFVEPNNYGESFNRNGGGVYAMEWTSSVINIWFFPPKSVPDSLSSPYSYLPAYSHPDTSAFGRPSASFAGPCSTSFGDKLFNHSIVLDTTFCGGWAGSMFGKEGSQCPKAKDAVPLDSCTDFVGNNPSAFKEAFWDIKSLRVWEKVFGFSAQSYSNQTIPSLEPELIFIDPLISPPVMTPGPTPVTVSPLSGGILISGEPVSNIDALANIGDTEKPEDFGTEDADAPLETTEASPKGAWKYLLDTLDESAKEQLNHLLGAIADGFSSGKWDLGKISSMFETLTTDWQSFKNDDKSKILAWLADSDDPSVNAASSGAISIGLLFSLIGKIDEFDPKPPIARETQSFDSLEPMASLLKEFFGTLDEDVKTDLLGALVPTSRTNFGAKRQDSDPGYREHADEFNNKYENLPRLFEQGDGENAAHPEDVFIDDGQDFIAHYPTVRTSLKDLGEEEQPSLLPGIIDPAIETETVAEPKGYQDALKSFIAQHFQQLQIFSEGTNLEGQTLISKPLSDEARTPALARRDDALFDDSSPIGFSGQFHTRGESTETLGDADRAHMSVGSLDSNPDLDTEEKAKSYEQGARKFMYQYYFIPQVIESLSEEEQAHLANELTNSESAWKRQSNYKDAASPASVSLGDAGIGDWIQNDKDSERAKYDFGLLDKDQRDSLYNFISQATKCAISGSQDKSCLASIETAYKKLGHPKAAGAKGFQSPDSWASDSDNAFESAGFQPSKPTNHWVPHTPPSKNYFQLVDSSWMRDLRDFAVSSVLYGKTHGGQTAESYVNGVSQLLQTSWRNLDDMTKKDILAVLTPCPNPLYHHCDELPLDYEWGEGPSYPGPRPHPGPRPYPPPPPHPHRPHPRRQTLARPTPVPVLNPNLDRVEEVDPTNVPTELDTILGFEGTLDPFGMLGPQTDLPPAEFSEDDPPPLFLEEDVYTEDVDDDWVDVGGLGLDELSPLDPFGMLGPQIPGDAGEDDGEQDESRELLLLLGMPRLRETTRRLMPFASLGVIEELLHGVEGLGSHDGDFDPVTGEHDIDEGVDIEEFVEAYGDVGGISEHATENGG